MSVNAVFALLAIIGALVMRIILQRANKKLDAGGEDSPKGGLPLYHIEDVKLVIAFSAWVFGENGFSLCFIWDADRK
jgi:hypothetical protein